MTVILNNSGNLFELYTYTTEEEFERDVVSHADYLFGTTSIYIDVKKRVKPHTHKHTHIHSYLNKILKKKCTCF